MRVDGGSCAGGCLIDSPPALCPLVGFLVGLCVPVLAVAPPVEALARPSPAVPMTQHLLLMIVAPQLIWLGAPVVPVLLGLPTRTRKAVAAWLARPPVRHLR